MEDTGQTAPEVGSPLQAFLTTFTFVQVKQAIHQVLSLNSEAFPIRDGQKEMKSVNVTHCAGKLNKYILIN